MDKPMDKPTGKPMDEMTFLKKKQIISVLKSEYENTDLSNSAKRRIRVGIDTQLQHSRKAIPMGFVLGSVGAVAAIVFFALVFVNSNKNVPPEGEVFAEAKQVEGMALTQAGDAIENRTQLSEGDIVKTRGRSSVKMNIGAHHMRVAQQSELVLKSLDSRRLQFVVERGKTHFDVAKLKPHQRLSVQSGDVTIEVVGTRFSVNRRGDCVELEVTEGRVKTTYLNKHQFFVAGQRREFCSSNKNIAKTEMKADSSVVASVSADEIISKKFRAIDELSVDPPASAGQALALEKINKPLLEGKTSRNTAQVQLFDTAHRALTNGSLHDARKLFEKYLRWYPSGLFAEDAQFRLVRISFRLKQFNQVISSSAHFLSKYSGSGHRLTEVRILRAQAFMQRNQFHEALSALKVGGAHLDAHTVRHRHQILYLQFAASCSAGVNGQCKKSATKYIQEYPTGPFFTQAQGYAQR